MNTKTQTWFNQTQELELAMLLLSQRRSWKHQPLSLEKETTFENFSKKSRFISWKRVESTLPIWTKFSLSSLIWLREMQIPGRKNFMTLLSRRQLRMAWLSCWDSWELTRSWWTSSSRNSPHTMPQRTPYIYIVFKSPVKSSYWVPNMVTETVTG